MMLQVQDVDFLLNRALSLTQMENLSRNPTILKWLRETTKTPHGGKREWLRRSGYLQGRGGGAFIALRNRRRDSTVTVDLGRLSVEQNSAVTGGNDSRKDAMRSGTVQEVSILMTRIPMTDSLTTVSMMKLSDSAACGRATEE